MGSISTTSSCPVSTSNPVPHENHENNGQTRRRYISPEAGRAHRRRISPEAGHALEILGHAIEYLSDEFVHAGGSLTAHDGQVEAVQLLMGINRQIYFDCPVVPSFSERWRALLHIGTA